MDVRIHLPRRVLGAGDGNRAKKAERLQSFRFRDSHLICVKNGSARLGVSCACRSLRSDEGWYNTYLLIIRASMNIGFIGQGFIGKNYADDFEKRGYDVERYALEAPYNENKHRIASCNIVFVAVPTPTTPAGFDDSMVRDAILVTAPGTIVVIKSTMTVGSTERIQHDVPDRIILHSPEFLTESKAAYDAAHPTRNIVGISADTSEQREAATQVLAVLPSAPFSLICTAKEAELIKYTANCFLFTKVIFANLMHDLAERNGASWDTIREGVAADPRIGGSHFRVIDTSGHHGAKPGRGAGGHCFIKDFAALRAMYAESLADDTLGLAVLESLEAKNKQLLTDSNKDTDLLYGVYGEQVRKTESE